ncbi:hypothetical protein GNF18_05895 [Ligilactobacillus pobuzihii]|uniref:hypothetical protein n=1 Tax=Ligilactobacillus pobuzihii TaxID=449659 RepID=UPI0019D2997F|nr:hypothetical protein [Ligilactobacillus pobuzihii]MBN7274665.1 hypothetical protein [Ligilactobacillus pobuzihii]
MEIIEYVFTKQDVEIQADEQNSWQFRAGFIYPVIQEEGSSELQVYFHLLESDDTLHQRVLVIEKSQWQKWTEGEKSIHLIPAVDMDKFMEEY